MKIRTRNKNYCLSNIFMKRKTNRNYDNAKVGKSFGIYQHVKFQTNILFETIQMRTFRNQETFKKVVIFSLQTQLCPREENCFKKNVDLRFYVLTTSKGL